LASGEYDKAIAIYRSLIADNPLDLAYYQYLVDAYNEAGRYNDSLKAIEEAKKKFGNSDPQAVLMMTGMVHYKNKKYGEAEKAFKQLVSETEQKSDDAYYYLGSVYLDQEKYDQAEAQFRKAIQINPTSANALNALGYMFADRGVKLGEAKELITQALDLNPTAPHILDSMGWLLYKSGDLKGAEEYVERAARHFEDPEIFSHLGEIYAKQGKVELARQMFERVLELDPDHKDIRKKLDKISANGTD
jgi:tetratricopeptide (TPR) repeat protein